MEKLSKKVIEILNLKGLELERGDPCNGPYIEAEDGRFYELSGILNRLIPMIEEKAKEVKQ